MDKNDDTIEKGVHGIFSSVIRSGEVREFEGLTYRSKDAYGKPDIRTTMFDCFTFIDEKIENYKFSNCAFIECSFANVKEISNVVFRNCLFYKCNFGKVNLDKVAFELCHSERSNFKDTVFGGNCHLGMVIFPDDSMRPITVVPFE